MFKEFFTEGIFEIKGIEKFVIVSDGDMYDLETGEVVMFDPSNIYHARGKRYNNFLFDTKKEAEKVIKREWNYDDDVDVLSVRVPA